MYKTLSILILSLLLLNCQQNTAQESNSKKIRKTTAEWKKQLNALEFYVLREQGTERAFTGVYDKFYKKGTYHCKGCNTPLFKSNHKFNSGTGWPSFDTPIKNNVAYTTDYELGYARTEIHCSICNGHLGHVFNDGPKETTGKRYCVNSVSLQFNPEK